MGRSKISHQPSSLPSDPAPRPNADLLSDAPPSPMRRSTVGQDSSGPSSSDPIRKALVHSVPPSALDHKSHERWGAMTAEGRDLDGDESDSSVVIEVVVPEYPAEDMACEQGLEKLVGLPESAPVQVDEERSMQVEDAPKSIQYGAGAQGLEEGQENMEGIQDGARTTLSAPAPAALSKPLTPMHSPKPEAAVPSYDTMDSPLSVLSDTSSSHRSSTAAAPAPHSITSLDGPSSAVGEASSTTLTAAQKGKGRALLDDLPPSSGFSLVVDPQQGTAVAAKKQPKKAPEKKERARRSTASVGFTAHGLGGIGGAQERKEIEAIIRDCKERMTDLADSALVPPMLVTAVPLAMVDPPSQSVEVFDLANGLDEGETSSHVNEKRAAAQALIETPSFRKVSAEEDAARRLASRGGNEAGEDEEREETKDAYYTSLHRRYDMFEKKQKRREKERLQHERYKMQQRLELIKGMDRQAFAALVASSDAPALPAPPSTGGTSGQAITIDQAASDANDLSLRRVAPEELRARMVEEAEDILRRYDQLLPVESRHKQKRMEDLATAEEEDEVTVAPLAPPPPPSSTRTSTASARLRYGGGKTAAAEAPAPARSLKIKLKLPASSTTTFANSSLASTSQLEIATSTPRVSSRRRSSDASVRSESRTSQQPDSVRSRSVRTRDSLIDPPYSPDFHEEFDDEPLVYQTAGSESEREAEDADSSFELDKSGRKKATKRAKLEGSSSRKSFAQEEQARAVAAVPPAEGKLVAAAMSNMPKMGISAYLASIGYLESSDGALLADSSSLAPEPSGSTPLLQGSGQPTSLFPLPSVLPPSATDGLPVDVKPTSSESLETATIAPAAPAVKRATRAAAVPADSIAAGRGNRQPKLRIWGYEPGKTASHTDDFDLDGPYWTYFRQAREEKWGGPPLTFVVPSAPAPEQTSRGLIPNSASTAPSPSLLPDSAESFGSQAAALLPSSPMMGMVEELHEPLVWGGANAVGGAGSGEGSALGGLDDMDEIEEREEEELEGEL